MAPGRKGETKKHRSVESRRERVAILETLGYSPGDIAKALPHQTQQTTYNDRVAVHDNGMIGKLQEKVKDNTVDLVAERLKLATTAMDIVNRKSTQIASQKPEDIKLTEATFALKAIESTEHSGKRAEQPRIEVNIKQNAQINIAECFSGINSILERCGVDLDKFLPST